MRKIQITSDGTCLVSIPKNWARQFNLKKGSLINIRERADGCLILDPQYAIDVSPEITLKMSRRIEDSILSSYLLGYELMTIETPKLTVEYREKIVRAVNRLIGVEIIEENPSRIVLQCMLKPTAFTPEKILRREYVLSSGMVNDAFNAFLKADLPLARSLQKQDEEVDRLYFLLVRLLRSLIINPRLSEKMNISLIECLDYRLIASLVENIADQAVEIADRVAEVTEYHLPSEIIQNIQITGGSIRNAYEEAIKAIFSKDERVLLEATGKRMVAWENLRRLEESLREQKKLDPYLAYTFLSNVRKILECLEDLSDLVTTIQ